jgi:hypothetical protein
MLETLNDVQTAAFEEIKKGKRINKHDFSRELEILVYKEGVEYVNALLYLCEVYDVDYEKVGNYLTETIKLKIAQQEGLLNRIYHINSSLT